MMRIMTYLSNVRGEGQVPTTPESNKQRAGKRRPSDLVAWEQYDKLVDRQRDRWYSLNEISSKLRRKDFTLDELRNYGATIISDLSELCSVELELTRVYELGAIKYSPHGWKDGVNVSLSAEATWRHINEHMDGHIINTEDGSCRSLAHALWGILTMLWMWDNKREYWDIGT